jgi:DNA ligase D-like protein (predicted 3'-phosphoesterase)
VQAKINLIRCHVTRQRRDLYIARWPGQRFSRRGSVLQNSLLDHIPARRWWASSTRHIGTGGLGAARSSRRRIFVVQKRDALQHDFRLAIHGVLVSWAMPKASMDPLEERPATRTEDHPLEYAEFEGMIPVGQYGVGTVIVRRTGTYDPQNSIPLDKQLALGKIGVGLRCVKLRGSFTLNSNPKAFGCSHRRKRWLLIKNCRNRAPRALAVFPSFRHRRPGQP